MALFTGSGVAIVTPFTDNGVDFDKLKELINWQISEGTDAIIICGTTGEASTMTEKERKDTIKFTVDVVNKRIPVIAGTGNNNTASTIEMSKWAEEIGVDGLLIITPYYNKTSAKGLFAHFEAVNNSVNIPIVVYNVPSRTGMNITPEELLKLSDLSNIVAVKEASGNISQVLKIKALCGDKIDIYSGNDDQIISVLSVGGCGVISVLANVMPKEVHEMCKLYLDGKTTEALNLQLKTLELANALFIETNPIPVKVALNLMGYNVGNLRLPLCEMDAKNEAILKEVLNHYNLLH